MSKLHALRRIAVRTCLTAVCCVMTMTALAQEFMNVSDIQEGMTGYAKTVVHGNEISLGTKNERVMFDGPILDKVQNNVIKKETEATPVSNNNPTFFL